MAITAFLATPLPNLYQNLALDLPGRVLITSAASKAQASGRLPAYCPQHLNSLLHHSLAGLSIAALCLSEKGIVKEERPSQRLERSTPGHRGGDRTPEECPR